MGGKAGWGRPLVFLKHSYCITDQVFAASGSECLCGYRDQGRGRLSGAGNKCVHE